MSHAPPHELSAREVVLAQETDEHAGLTERQVRVRRERYGENVLPARRGRPSVMLFLLQFHHPLIYVLLAAAVVTVLVGDRLDAGVILGVVVVNAIVGFVQESRAEQALTSLLAMVRTQATVVRDGHEVRLDSAELVPGDVVLLEPGDKVPADLRLVRVRELSVDESSLTGESQPVGKQVGRLPGSTPLADRRNLAYSGTLVTHGHGTGVVVSTGTDTELGLVHHLVGQAQQTQTPLSRKIARFSRVLTVAILGLAALTFGIGVVRGEPIGHMLTAAVALAVGAIPEGLPAVVTITLAVGVARMARRDVIVRQLPAVETLGSTTVICTDKTGTLTKNEMTVTSLYTAGHVYDVTGTGYTPSGQIRHTGVPARTGDNLALDACLLAGALCNDSQVVAQDGRWVAVGDPTEAALVVSAAKAGLDVDDCRATHLRIDAVPFESERQYMATLHRESAGAAGTVYLKGAVERVLGICTGQAAADGQVEPLDRGGILTTAEQFAGRGLRVLALANSRVPADFSEFSEPSLAGLEFCFLGLAVMQDPPREEAAASVAACRTAGIGVKMITGDHAATAGAIAAQIAMNGAERGGQTVLTGAELDSCTDEELAAVVARTAVFARVSPQQKLRLVLALQGQGQVVAMTGDGVNDAPALKQADIGVAMGRAGTDVAKDASDMVLTNDDFASIKAAVEEGRGVFANLTKFIVWALPANIALGLVLMAAIVAGTALPLLPVQVLWLNMTTVVALGLPLAVEAVESEVMRRPPRDPARPLLSRSLVGRVLLASVLLLAAAFGLFHWEQAHGASITQARTVVVNVFAAMLLGYLVNCRSLDRSLPRTGTAANRWVALGVTATAGLQLAFTYLPVMNTLFHSAPLDGAQWLRIAGAALSGYLIVEADKRLRSARGTGAKVPAN